MKTKTLTFLNNPKLQLITPKTECICCYQQYALWWNLGNESTLYPVLKIKNKNENLPDFLDLSWLMQ